jgi:hypothetical protein
MGSYTAYQDCPSRTSRTHVLHDWSFATKRTRTVARWSTVDPHTNVSSRCCTHQLDNCNNEIKQHVCDYTHTHTHTPIAVLINKRVRIDRLCQCCRRCNRVHAHPHVVCRCSVHKIQHSVIVSKRKMFLFLINMFYWQINIPLHTCNGKSTHCVCAWAQVSAVVCACTT